MVLLIFTFFLVNLIAFVLIGYDKKLAKNNKRRISEQTLLFWVALGGTIGSLLAMSIFRHKTAKTSYLLKFFSITLIQILTVYLLISNYIIQL
ncbi:MULTISPECIES: DUF1294 domain-containing protein [Flavobacterium]|uniref:DUF1294 domain-containing protein n=1 Tax=Flavobacterium TaxID=237 RepID=UPI0022AC3FEF|nr:MULTISPECIES: DUF1294 domain-containing protein [Flavobacterium]